MSSISRRDFLKSAATYTAAAGFLSAGVLELRANPARHAHRMPDLARPGNDRQGFSRHDQSSLPMPDFRPSNCARPSVTPIPASADLAKYKGAELRKILGDAGVTCISSHFGIEELRENQERAIDWAKDVGLTQMLVPSLDGPKKPDHGRREESRRRIQQNGRAGSQSRHPAGTSQRRLRTLHRSTASEPTTCCSACSIPSWSSSSSRFPPSAMATTPPNISRNIPAASFPCTCKAGPRQPRRSCPWDRTLWIGKESSPRQKPAA